MKNQSVDCTEKTMITNTRSPVLHGSCSRPGFEKARSFLSTLGKAQWCQFNCFHFMFRVANLCCFQASRGTLVAKRMDHQNSSSVSLNRKRRQGTRSGRHRLLLDNAEMVPTGFSSGFETVGSILDFLLLGPHMRKTDSNGRCRSNGEQGPSHKSLS